MPLKPDLAGVLQHELREAQVVVDDQQHAIVRLNR